MKCLLLALLIGLSLQTFSQESTTSVYNKDYYLKKSKTQKTIGWVVLGAGTSLIAAGLITGSGKSDDLGDVFAGGAYIVSGVVLDAVSIPFFVSASKNKKRAVAAVAFRIQPMFQPKNNFAISQQPTLSVKIGF